MRSSANPLDLRSPVDWLLKSDLDTLIVLAFLVLAPVAWWMGRFRWHWKNSVSTGRWSFARLAGWIGRLPGPIGLVSEQASLAKESFSARVQPVWMSIVVAATSLTASLAVGARFDDLPPAYHDEYSYLFQAQTFLAGRVSYPSHVAPRLFDQMHVLNEGQFASRYFPGAGLWMAPFVAAGHPYWGHWLAGAICAVLTFWITRELAGDAVGLIAGLLTAVSPGMALFSNLLLAHHPTLVGLGIFLLGFFRMIRFSSWRWALVSGSGLAFAMICRPMTAAGVALPLGIWFLARALNSMLARRAGGGHRFSANCSPRMGSLATALALPIAITLAGLFFYDKAVTGNGWLTPYSVYTTLHTPSHVYGFNNVERGRQYQGPRVIENYDKWAENLTPALALENAGTRWAASWKWTLGLLPQSLALCAGFVLWRRLPTGTWLVLAAILSLHAVHIPYWFVGMEDHHYVFESGPLWAVWMAVVTGESIRVWNSTGHRATCIWWVTLLAAAVALNWAEFFLSSSGQQPGPINRDQANRDQLNSVQFSGQWSAPLAPAINRITFAREKHGRFDSLVRQRALPVPALVLVEADPADRHIDYVANPPDLLGPVLIAHYLPDQVPLTEVRRLFPDRKLFLYRVRQDDWRDLN